MIRKVISSALLFSIMLISTNETNAQLLSKHKSESGTTLASRLSKLKKAFFHEDESQEETRDTSRRGNSLPQTPPLPPESNRIARIPEPAANHGRVKQGDFLPKGIFDRNANPGHRGEGAVLGDDVYVTEPRRGSIVSDGPETMSSSKVVRRSPAVQRENELDEALSDLLGTDLDNGAANRQPRASRVKRSSNSEGDASGRQGAASDESFILEQKPKGQSRKLQANEQAENTDEAINELRQKFEKLEQKQPEKRVLEFPGASYGMPHNSRTQPSHSQHESLDGRSAISAAERFSPNQPPLKKSSFLSTSKQPTIMSRIEGPAQIMVGREATYRVTLENDGQEVARNILAEVRIPEWADVVDAISTSGVVEQIAGNEAGVLRWKLQDLAGKNKQSLAIKLVPRSGKPLQLSVRWSQAPVASQAMVEVQEPKLEMKFGGPQEVSYNKPQRFELQLRNPGTGPAENVSIRLIPPGGDGNSASTHQIGTLAAGSSKKIELELTAREAGDLMMKAYATAAGGLEVVSEREVHCRKAELEVDWKGPQEKYAGTEAPYYFRVRNTGTADASAVQVKLTLPQGAKLISASKGYKVNQSTGSITWNLSSISAGQAEYLQVLCKLDRAGTNRFDLVAENETGIASDVQEIETNVIAVADLKLSITDPKGPVPVGDTALYEIKIINRGSTSAQNVGVVGLFSEGIDPTAVEGAQFSVRDGRVSIHPINSLPAGQELVLRIRAVASQPGTHVFRAEVSCKDLDIKLAAEETTKFYEDKFRWEDGETAYSSDADQRTLSR